MSYNKITVSKVLELRKDLGLVVEVNEGTNGKPNDLVLWLQYKTDNNEWAYKGSNGATGIRIPITDGLEKFLADTLKASFDASKKFTATKANKTPKIDVNVINSLTAEQKQALLLALTGQAQQPSQGEPEPVLSLENLLHNLQADKSQSKGKGKNKK